MVRGTHRQWEMYVLANCTRAGASGDVLHPPDSSGKASGDRGGPHPPDWMKSPEAESDVAGAVASRRPVGSSSSLGQRPNGPASPWVTSRTERPPASHHRSSSR